MILQIIFSIFFINSGFAEQVEPGRNWNMGLSYSLNANINQQRSPKTYYHSFGVNFGQEINDNFQWSTALGLSAQSEGTNISLQEENPTWEDLGFSGTYKLPVYEDKTLVFFLDEALPTSIYSRREGIRSIVRSGVTFSSPTFIPQLNWHHNLSATHWLHSYKESSETLKSNANFEVGYILGFKYALSEGIKIGVKQNSRVTRFFDNESMWRTTTTEYIHTTYKQLSLTLSYRLGSYDQSDGYRFIYFDEVNQFLGLEASYEI